MIAAFFHWMFCPRHEFPECVRHLYLPGCADDVWACRCGWKRRYRADE